MDIPLFERPDATDKEFAANLLTQCLGVLETMEEVLKAAQATADVEVLLELSSLAGELSSVLATLYHFQTAPGVARGHS
jgi:hypothetical protein